MENQEIQKLIGDAVAAATAPILEKIAALEEQKPMKEETDEEFTAKVVNALKKSGRII